MEIEKTETNEIDPLDLFEHDPIVIAKSQRDRIIARELARLPNEFHANVLSRPLSELHRRIRSAIETFRNDLIDAALNDFALTLRSAAAHERETNPALILRTPESTVKPWADRLTALRRNGYEIGLLIQYLATPKMRGATITGADYRVTQTDRGPISRDDLIEFAQGLRPVGRLDDKVFFSNFTPEASIVEAERAAARREHERLNPVYKSGPPRLIGTPIQN